VRRRHLDERGFVLRPVSLTGGLAVFALQAPVADPGIRDA
jgi:hypothetical protein